MDYNNKTPQQFFDELQVNDLVKVLHRDIDNNDPNVTKWYAGSISALKALNNKPARVVDIGNNKKVIVWPRQFNTHIQHHSE